MTRLVRFSVMLFATLGFAMLPCAGQTAGTGSKASPEDKDKFDLGLTYTYKLAKISTTTGWYFGLQGGSIDGVYWLGPRAKNFGLAFDLNGETASNITPGVNLSQLSIVAGPRYTLWRVKAGRFKANLYGQGLVGYVRAFDGVFVSGTTTTSSANSFALQAGGGLNLPLNRKWGLRLFEADYVYTQLPNSASNYQGDERFSGGVTYHFSAPPPVPITIACSANPASVFPGEPVTVTATAGSLDPKLNAVYSWSGTGATGSGTTASIATAALAAGSYTVNCGVKEGKAGKEGLKPWESANASASFTVKAYEPPTLSCSANPSTIKPGETSDITAAGLSPQNRPLTYSYSAAAGTVSGSGTTAVFSSAGAPTGTTPITCNVSDDKGQTATAGTSVTVEAPYVPPIPHAQALCSIAFETDKKRPTRVDNEARACLDEIALDLQKQSDAKAVVVGNSTAAEKTPAKGKKHAKVEDLAAERAVNTKDYLVTEKGIDASRISGATGTTDEQKVEDYLVPSGATFANDVTGTTPVDETVVKPQVRKPLHVKRAHKKAGVK